MSANALPAQLEAPGALKDAEPEAFDPILPVDAPALDSLRGGNTLKVACIGAGDIVRATHLPVLKNLRGAEVAWVADVDAARARELAAVYKVPARPLPANLAELPEADVYLLACPYGVRLPYYEALQDRGAAIYVEKPFSRSPEEHDELCSRFPDYALASGLMMRCWGPNRLVRKLVQQQLFGPLRAVRFGFGRPGLVTQGRYYFDKGKGGAGMMSEVGIHGIDTALFVAGAVSADLQRSQCIAEGEFDLHTEASLTLHNQAGHTTDFSFTVSSLAHTLDGIECEFDTAVVSWSLPGQGYANFAESIDMDVKIRPLGLHSQYTLLPGSTLLYPATKFQMFHENWSEFLEGVVSRQANFTSACQARLVSEVIHNCYQAAERT